MKTTNYLVLTVALNVSFPAYSNVNIENLCGQDVNTLLQEQFNAPGMEISNATFNGKASIPYGEGTQIALFNNSGCDKLKIKKGLMLSTNHCAEIAHDNPKFVLGDLEITKEDLYEYANLYAPQRIMAASKAYKPFFTYYNDYCFHKKQNYKKYNTSIKEQYEQMMELMEDPAFFDAYKGIANYDTTDLVWENHKNYYAECLHLFPIYAVYSLIKSYDPAYYNATSKELQELRTIIENHSQNWIFQELFCKYLHDVAQTKTYNKEKEQMFAELYEKIGYRNVRNRQIERPNKGKNDLLNAPAILEFDFSTIDDTVAFNYVFASANFPYDVWEEIFYCIVTDLTTGEEKSIATIPGTDLLISNKNINDKTNKEYFISNYQEDSYNLISPYNLKLRGFTTSLSAKTEVVPCRKYHLKMVIGKKHELLNTIYNWLFYNYDSESAVFIEGCTTKKGGISTKTSYSKRKARGIAKECSEGKIVVKLRDSDTPTTLTIKHIGEAKSGIDYKVTPEEITLPAHQDSTILELIPLRDIEEDSLQIMVTIVARNTCTDTKEDTVVSHIYNAGPISITPNKVANCATELSVEHTGPIRKIKWEPASLLQNSKDFTVYPIDFFDKEQTFIITAENIFGCKKVKDSIKLKPCLNEIGMTVKLETDNGSSELVEGCNTGKLVFNVQRSFEGKDNVTIKLDFPADKKLEGLPREVIIPANETTVEIPVTAKKEGTPYYNTFNVVATCENCVTGPVAIEIKATQPAPLLLKGNNSFRKIEGKDLNINVPLLSGAIGEVVWLPTDLLENINDLTATISEDFDSTMVYTVIATDTTGCQSASATVKVKMSKELDLTIPTFFTPNDDGINNIWKVNGLENTQKSRVRVYDRWGRQVAEFNPNTEGWDGTYKGHQCPSTDYWYIVDCEEKDNVYSGHFTLIRK